MIAGCGVARVNVEREGAVPCLEVGMRMLVIQGTRVKLKGEKAEVQELPTSTSPLGSVYGVSEAEVGIFLACARFQG
jgi:hypothetical protein